MIESVDADYTRTAYLKGLSRSQVVSKHVLRNSLLPTIAVIATQVGYLIGGLLVIEKLFNYNGIGQRIYVAAQNKDFIMLQSGVMIVGVVFLVATLDRRHPLLGVQPPGALRSRRMSGMIDDAAGIEPALGFVPTEAQIARREMLAQLARSKTFILGSVIVAFWVFWGLVGAHLTPDDPLGQSESVLAPPSSAHWFGTDQLGRDVFSRVLARRVGHAQHRPARDAARDRRRAPASA